MNIFDFFFKHASLPVFVLNKKGEIEHLNGYAEKLLGLAVVGVNFQDVIVDFHGVFDLEEVLQKPDHPHLLNLKIENDLPQTFFFNFLLSNEKIYVFGQPDQDEIEAIRNEILSLNLELSNLTRELHKKNAQLKELNAEKNRFLGMAAHDLRKPIGLVSAFSEFLIEEAGQNLGEEHRGFLHTINGSSMFMKRLVDDFLDTSAIEAGRFELDLQPTDMALALANSLKLNNIQAAKKGISLTIRCADEMPSVIMDGPKVEQAITNLVSNAIEHSDSDGRVRISLTRDGEAVVFAVKDQGPGIPIEEQGNLFKPFHTTSAKKTGGEKSTGLGLLISRKIIEAHQGRIWVESQAGQGCTISFSLPLRPEAK